MDGGLRDDDGDNEQKKTVLKNSEVTIRSVHCPKMHYIEHASNTWPQSLG